jgi:hypothetical protein
MRSLVLAALLVLAFSSAGDAQVGQVQVLGPYQPNPFGGYVYISPWPNPYYGRVAPGYGRSRAYERGYEDGRYERSFNSGRAYRARWSNQ